MCPEVLIKNKYERHKISEGESISNYCKIKTGTNYSSQSKKLPPASSSSLKGTDSNQADTSFSFHVIRR